jgi:preprotein translocase subunit SecE
VAAPRKRSKRRRAPHQAQSVRARPQPPAGRAADAVKRPDAPPEPVDVVAPVDSVPTLEEVDLAAGAPPENLGVPTSHPPEDLAGIVTGELADDVDDEEGEDLTVEEPAQASRPGRVGRAGADQLDAEDELLPAARQASGRPPAKVGGNKVTSFLRASWAELQRVQWPNRRQVGQATAVVLGFVVIAGGYLGLADVISQKIVDAIL